jgi:hypothetical protein
MSAKTVHCIYQDSYREYVTVEGYSCVKKLFAEDNVEVTNHFVNPDNIFSVLASIPVDSIVFNNCDDTPNDVNALGRMLRNRFPNFIGCGPEYIEKTSFKSWATDLLVANNVPTPGYVLVSAEHPGTEEEVLKLGPGKYFIKVDKGFDSVGITDQCVCATAEAALIQARQMSEQWGPCVINPMIPGREFTIAVYDQKVGAPLEKILRSHAFYASSQISETEVCKETVLVEELQRLALAAYNAVGGDSYCRVDIRQDPLTLQNYVLDVNSVCSIAPDSYFFMSLAECHREDWRTTKPQFIAYLLASAGKSQKMYNAPSTLSFALAAPVALAVNTSTAMALPSSINVNNLFSDTSSTSSAALSQSDSPTSSSSSTPRTEEAELLSSVASVSQQDREDFLISALRRASLTTLSVSA